MRAKPVRCPACGCGRSKVVDVRDEPHELRKRLRWNPDEMWRARKCLACATLYDTAERVVVFPPKKTATSCNRPRAHVLS